MIKFISLLFLALLTLNFQMVYAANVSNTNETAIEEEFDFTKNSQYLTDEQIQAAQEVHDIEDKSGFDAKIINSSHFSSNTATKTYIPINKVQK